MIWASIREILVSYLTIRLSIFLQSRYVDTWLFRSLVSRFAGKITFASSCDSTQVNLWYDLHHRYSCKRKVSEWSKRRKSNTEKEAKEVKRTLTFHGVETRGEEKWNVIDFLIKIFEASTNESVNARSSQCQQQSALVVFFSLTCEVQSPNWILCLMKFFSHTQKVVVSELTWKSVVLSEQ